MKKILLSVCMIVILALPGDGAGMFLAPPGIDETAPFRDNVAEIWCHQSPAFLRSPPPRF